MNMLWNNSKFRLSSIVCLLPLLLSLYLYPHLPAEVVVQWDSNGEPVRLVSKELAAFGLPVFFFLTNLTTRFFISSDPKRTQQSQPKILVNFSYWISPIFSLVFVPFSLLHSQSNHFQLVSVMPILLGALFLFIGNYLPKCRQNYTIGIKLPWTLHDATNWNKTHHLAGYLWIVSGFIQIGHALFSWNTSLSLQWIPNTSLFLSIFLPILYSYCLYQSHERSKSN